jgi:hypothetical protein
VGRVVPTDGVVPWLVVGSDGELVEPVRRFLTHFVARDNRPGSVRSSPQPGMNDPMTMASLAPVLTDCAAGLSPLGADIVLLPDFGGGHCTF